jgi:putative pyruvate formate lyase activating enzyme
MHSIDKMFLTSRRLWFILEKKSTNGMSMMSKNDELGGEPVRRKTDRIRSQLKKAYSLLKSCRICPRRCGVDRIRGERGFCRVGFLPVVSSDNMHRGEEPPISGSRGSGTIFFTGCSLGCVYCQNYPISQFRHGNPVSLNGLAQIMMRLQNAGSHNINLVTPTHFAPQIMGSLLIAFGMGLRIPLVYNCGGYESIEMIRLWEGIIDIYLPDMKYDDSDMAEKFSGARDYPEINKQVVVEMHRQAGHLEMDGNGIAFKGLLIRHLVLPENVSGTDRVLKFISESLSKDTAISLMNQYFPAHQAVSMHPVQRRLTEKEYALSKRLLKRYGLTQGWVQRP